MTNEYLLEFFNKAPGNMKEWKRDSESINVFLGVFSRIIETATRNGVALALNDTLGGGKNGRN